MNIREAIKTAKEGKKVFNPRRTDVHHQNVVWVYYKCLHGEYLTDEKTNTHFVDIFTKPNDLDEGWEVVGGRMNKEDEEYNPDCTGKGANIGDITKIITDPEIVKIWEKFIKNKED